MDASSDATSVSPYTDIEDIRTNNNKPLSSLQQFMGARRTGGLGFVIRCLLCCVRAHSTIVSFLGGPSLVRLLAPFFPTPSLGSNYSDPRGPVRCGLLVLPTATPMAAMHDHPYPAPPPLDPPRLAVLGVACSYCRPQPLWQQCKPTPTLYPVAYPHYWHPPGFCNGMYSG